MWYKRLETFWHQKSKDKWLQNGDANSKFFHLTTIIHARANKIASIKKSDNSVVYDWDNIGNCFLDYYSIIFKSNFNVDHLPFPSNLENLFSKCISEVENTEICSIPSPAEIRKVMFSFASTKSPGPDGLPPLFYKSFWKTTSHALIHVVQHFFKIGHLLKALNHTFIALIPKKRSATLVEHYRPISLCNVTYKIISKILANRLRPFLNSFISPFQLAFVKGRNIHDNNIASHEIMNYLHKKKGKIGYMAIKVDLAKAFDKVEWSLLICILNNIGFCSKFTGWIMECISTSSLSFLVNGSPFGLLKPSRGIRQGDPISHFPFCYLHRIAFQVSPYGGK